MIFSELKNFWPKRLRIQLTLLAVLTISITLIFFVSYTVHKRSQRAMNYVKLQGQVLAKSISAGSVQPLILEDFASLEELLILFVQFPNVISVQVSDELGRVIGNVEKDDRGMAKIYFDKKEISVPLVIESNIFMDNGEMVIQYPIKSARLHGWVNLRYSLQDITELKRTILKDGLWLGVIMVIVNSVLLYFNLKKPVQAIERSIEFSKKLVKERGVQIPVDRSIKEIEELMESMNFASIQLEEQEKSLLDKTERLKVMFNNVAEGIITININKTIESFNPAAEKIFGYSKEEVMGQNVKILMPEPYLSEHDGYVNHYLKTGEAKIIGQGREVSGRKKDGTVFPMALSISEAKPGGDLIFIGTIRDITERKNFENALKESKKNLERKVLERTLDLKQVNEQLLEDIDRRKKVEKELKDAQMQLLQTEKMASIGHLAAGVAHEINNPVGFISSNMQTLEEYVTNYSKYLRAVENLKRSIEENNSEKVQRNVGELKELEEEMNLSFIMGDMDDLLRESRTGIERIKKIVLDLRTFSREGKDTYELIRIEEVIDGVLNIVHSEIKYKAELKKEYGETPLIKCNAQRLGQVFINLLVNAAQAIKEKGVIGVKTYVQAKNLYVEISDTGEGIEEEKLKDIFNPFFTTKPVGKGTGLGLSISYDIVKKHDGEILVRSKIGQGTTFTIRLPII